MQPNLKLKKKKKALPVRSSRVCDMNIDFLYNIGISLDC